MNNGVFRVLGGTRLPRIAAVTAGGALIVGITAGCATTPTAQAAAGQHSSPTATPTTTVSAAVAAATTPAGKTGPAAANPPAQQAGPKSTLPECTLSAGLGIKVDQEDDAAGQDRANLVFTNGSSGPCVIVGFPGVSFASEQGSSFGQAADRQGSIGPQITLAVGQQASAEIEWEDGSHVDQSQCNPQDASGFNVYPPDSYTDSTATFHGLDHDNDEQECATGQVLHVWSIVPGDSQANWH